MSLTRLNLILFPSVLALASPGWAEARQVNARAAQPRPLNLSLPRDVLNTPATGQVDEQVQRNLHPPAPAPGTSQDPARLRYGAGYELRHPQMTGGAATGGSASAGAGSGSAVGSGRRGR